MATQILEFDFTRRQENNSESQAILEANKDKINKPEMWRLIPWCDVDYMISNMGRVKRPTHVIVRKNGCPMPYTEKVLKNHNHTGGYNMVCLKTNGVFKHVFVHRLVAEAFIPKVENKTIVNHIDGNKKNNNVENLEWCNKSENFLHSYNVLKSFTVKRGSENGKSKLNEVQVTEIKVMLRADIDHEEIAEKFGVNPKTIGAIKYNRSWKHIA